MSMYVCMHVYMYVCMYVFHSMFGCALSQKFMFHGDEVIRKDDPCMCFTFVCVCRIVCIYASHVCI